MDTVVLEVTDRRVAYARIARACQSGQAARQARIGFATPQLLWQVLTETRWAILQALCGAGAMGLRELARKVRRNAKAVHDDTQALHHAGLIDRTTAGQWLFPYRHVTMHLELDAAQAH